MPMLCGEIEVELGSQTRGSNILVFDKFIVERRRVDLRVAARLFSNFFPWSLRFQ